MASQVISEKRAEFFWWMRSVQSCGEVLRRYLIKRRGAALPLLIEKIDSRRRAESIVTAGPEGCGRSGRSWCAWISLWSCLIETDGFQSRTHEPIYRYFRQSDGRSSNKLTLKTNVPPDHVGLKRCFIEHFKGYVMVFVSLKSVGNWKSYFIFSNTHFRMRVQPVNTWKFNLIADKFVVWSSCTHKMFGRLILELCGSWCFIEIGWKMNELFYF